MQPSARAGRFRRRARPAAAGERRPPEADRRTGGRAGQAGAGHTGSQGSRQQAGRTRRWPQRGRRCQGCRWYYDNSAAGDWDASYAQLSSNSTAYYTPEDWAANNALGTGTFEVTYAEETEPNVFYAEVLVNGTARDTYWIYDGGQYYHDLTTEEYAMFDDALAGGSATASSFRIRRAIYGQRGRRSGQRHGGSLGCRSGGRFHLVRGRSGRAHDLGANRQRNL